MKNKNIDLISRFNLPKYIKGKSFAEASKAIESKFEGLNDKAAKDTKQALMQRLADMQEYVKAQQQPSKEQYIDPSQQQMFLGGMLGGDEGAGFMEASGQVAGGAGASSYLQGAQSLFQAGNDIFGKTGIDTSGKTGNMEKFDTVGSTVGSTLQGVSAGSQIGGPLGAAIGGAIGLTGGIIGGKRKNDAISDANKNFDIANANNKINSFAMGGMTEDCGGPGEPPCQKKHYNSKPIEIKNKLGQDDVDQLAKDTGVRFSIEGANQLFYNQEYDIPKVPDIDYGKYKGAKYFDASLTGNGLRVSPTSANPQNPQGFNKQMAYIKKLNPDISFDDTKYVDFQNRKDIGGYQNQLAEGLDGRKGGCKDNQGNPIPCNDVDGIDYTLEPGTNIMSNQEGDSRFKFNTSIKNSLDNNIGGDFGKIQLQKPSSLIDYTKLSNNNEYKGLDGLDNKTVSKNTNINKSNKNNPKFDAAQALRYAPSLMNAFQLATLDKPEQEVRQRLDSKYNPQLVDEERIQRSIAANQGNTSRALQNVANGSKGFVAANMLGSDINTSKAIGQAAVQAQAQNNAQRQYGQQFNRQADQFNISQDNLEQDLTDRNKGVYDTNRSQLLSQIGNDLGAIGKEELFKKYPIMMGMNYKWNGEYFVNDKGDKKTKEEAEAIENSQNQSAMGGYQSTFSNHMNLLMNKKKK